MDIPFVQDKTKENLNIFKSEAIPKTLRIQQTVFNSLDYPIKKQASQKQ